MDSRKLLGFAIGVLLFLATLLFGTYAFYNWKSGNTDVTFNIGDSYFYCETGQNVSDTGLVPVLDYQATTSKYTFKVNNIGKSDTKFSVTLNISEISESLKSTSLKYKLMVDKTGSSSTCDTSSNCTEAASGDFSKMKRGINTIAPSIDLPNNSRYQYYLFIYIDGNMQNDTSMQSGTLKMAIEVCDIIVTLDYNGGNVVDNKEYIKVASLYTGLPDSVSRNTSNVTYDTAGGSSVSNDSVSYTFAGWYLENTFKNKVTASTEVKSTINHTLYAKWDPSKTVTLPTPTKTGYTFVGWYNGSSYVGAAGGSYNPSTSVNLTAHWNANKYNISYNLNNGTKGTSAPSDATYESIINITNPTKTVTITGNVNGTGATIGSATSKAQTFTGWTASNINTSTAYYGTSSSAVTTLWSNASTKVTAQYFKNLTLTNNATVKLEANWTAVAMTVPTISKTGYTCTWNTASDGSGTTYNSGASYTPLATGGNVTLYARCSVNKYNISYSLNNGVNGTSAPSSATYGSVINITNPTKTVTITGNVNGTGATIGSATSKAQTFAGWTASNINTSTAYYGTSSSAVSTLWSNVSTKVTATYFKNLNPTSNSTVTLTANWTAVAMTVPTVSKTGYTCTWNTKSDGSGTTYNSGASYTPSATGGNVTLYARCSANKYNISYSLNNGTKGTSTPSSATYGSVINITNPTKTVTITGNVNGTGATIGSATSKAQTFAGWTASNINTSTAYYGTSSSAVSTLWSNVSTKVTATYFKNLNPTSNSTVTLTANWTAVAMTVPTVSKTGYTCTWNTKSDGSGTTYNFGASYTPSATGGNVTLYARCTVNKYKITLDQQGATSTGSTSVTATYGSAMPTITKPAKAYKVTYNANSGSVSQTSAIATYTFGGYYTATGGSGTQYYTAAGASARNWDKTVNTTLYAKWTSASVTLPTPTRTGYTFSGWYTAASGGTKIGAGGASYTPTSNITIYAQWKRNFTCASAGSTTTYMGHSWYTIANSNGTCNLALNATSGSGSFNDAATNVLNAIKSYSNGKNTLQQEKNAGLVTTVDSAANTSKGLTSGVYWIKSGTVYDSTVRHSYSCSKISISHGMTNYVNTTLGEKRGCFTTPSASVLHNANSTIAVANNLSSITYSNGKYTSSSYDSGNKYSQYWSVFAPQAKGKVTSGSKVYLNLSTGNWNDASSLNQYKRSNKIIKAIICGGSYPGKTITWTYKSKTQFSYKHGGTGNSETYNYPNSDGDGGEASGAIEGVAPFLQANAHNFSFAGSVSSSVTNDVRTYNYSTSSNCISYNQYSISNLSVSIHYRPHIRVKT